MTTVALQYLESAIDCHKRGDFGAAEEQYQQALTAEPDNIYAIHSAGILALQCGNFPLAIERLQRAIELGASLPDTYLMLGRALKAQGDTPGAIDSYRLAIKVAPGNSVVHISLGLALKEQGQLSAAAAAYREALLVNPASFEARINLGNLLQLQGKFEAALAEYEKAKELRSDSAFVYYNLGKLLRAQQQDSEAVEHFQQAVKLDPEYLEAYLNLANALTAIGQYPAAIECYRYLQALLETGGGRVANQAIRERLYQDALTGMAAPLAWMARFDEALPIITQALASDPDSLALNEFYLLALPYSCESREEFLAAYTRYLRITPYRNAVPVAPAPRDVSGSKLKIGYVSGDFRDHSVAFFIEPLLAHHDRNAFEVVCYATNIEDDHVTARLRQYDSLWRAAHDMDDAALAQNVVDDEIDVLIDLSGRTMRNRLGLFARQAAPLQMGYLGYPTYTGVPQIAYRITDAVIDPEDEAGLETELPLRLPRSMFCYRPPHDAPLPATIVQQRDFVCFGSFNQIQKLSPTVLAAWVRILAAVPGSRLLLKANGFNDQETRRRVVDTFVRNGIDAGRIIIRPGTPDRNAHLAMYGEIDVALDTYPYNGATTTCEALWMGTPVLTLRGATHSSRMGASILTALGLEELITATVDDYVDKAALLAGDVERRAQWRDEIRPRMQKSSLCDEQGYARDFEDLISAVWRQRVEQGA